jgi:hypothetical protein
LKYTLSKGILLFCISDYWQLPIFIWIVWLSPYFFNRLIERGDDNELVRAGLGYALLATTDQNMIIKGTQSMFTAIKLGTSEKISDYRWPLPTLTFD